MSRPICNYPAPYDFPVGDPYNKGSGIYFDSSGNGYIKFDPDAGGGSGIGYDPVVRSGGAVSTQTSRTRDTALTTTTGGDTPDDPNLTLDASGGLDGLLASPLQKLFNLALAQAAQPKPGAIVLSPDAAAGGSNFMSLKNLILIVLIGGGLFYVVRKYANK